MEMNRNRCGDCQHWNEDHDTGSTDCVEGHDAGPLADDFACQYYLAIVEPLEVAPVRGWTTWRVRTATIVEGGRFDMPDGAIPISFRERVVAGYKVEQVVYVEYEGAVK
jgi:hypothetical protein